MLTFDWAGGWFNFAGTMIDPARAFQTLRPTLHSDGRILADWSVPVDLAYFRGHFPGNPVFPAVGIVDATLQALRFQLNKPSLQLAGIPLAKFINPITPGQSVHLELKPLADSEWQAEWTEQGSDKLLSSLRLRCF